MKLGAYTACLHDKPLEEALANLRDLGLDSAEINSGGFLPPVHLPIDDIRASQDARDEYLALFGAHGITLTALNCNGNPLHPDAEVGAKHAGDVRDAIELAALLGVKRVVTMSGLPAAHAGGTAPSWSVVPWDSVYLDALEYQWGVAVEYWKDIQARASDADVKVCIEMHPHNVVYNAATMERLATRINATHVGAEMDPSHLFWQHIDPIKAIEDLGPLVFFAAAKDTLIHETAAINGVLDDRFEWIPAEQNPVGLGGRYTVTKWPEVPGWSFVAVGRGHDVDFWARFLTAIYKVDPDMPVNIEHEDATFGQIEGLKYAADNLLAAADQAGLA